MEYQVYAHPQPYLSVQSYLDIFHSRSVLFFFFKYSNGFGLKDKTTGEHKPDIPYRRRDAGLCVVFVLNRL